MDQQLFKPYLAETLPSGELRLTESAKRQTFLLLFYRLLLPLLGLAALCIPLWLATDYPYWWHLAVLAVAALIMLRYALKPYVLGVVLSDQYIEVESKMLFGKRIQRYNMIDIDHISVEVYYVITTGTFYRIVPKDGSKQVMLFNIPYLYSNAKNRAKVNEIIEKVTGKQVKNR